MKICGDCENYKECPGCGDTGWCIVIREFMDSQDSAVNCDDYDGPDDEPLKPHYQTENQRDNPRDPIIERR